MSVRTEADERLKSAKEHLQAAIKDLSEIAINKCWGYDEYSKEWKHKMKEMLVALLEMQEELD